MLELLKELLNITDTSKDNVLNHHLSKAGNSIKSYLNYKDDEMAGLFQTEIVDLAIFYYKNRNELGTIQMSQGGRSKTLERGIPKHILFSLPMPRVRIVGGR